MEHKVNIVQDLYDDAVALYNNYIAGSADSIINDLRGSYENLRNCWEGIDGGRQIQNIVLTHNALVVIRNAVGAWAEAASKVAANYRDVQNAAGAGLDALTPVRNENKDELPSYEDNRDKVSINTAEANVGLGKLTAANGAMDEFKSKVSEYYNRIMDNWLSGPGRDDAREQFDVLQNSVQQYKSTLTDVEESVKTAIQNYGV